MTCPRPLCGQPMAVDREFEVEAVAHGVPKRRWTDLRGHEVIEDRVRREPTGRDVADPIPLPRPCRLRQRMTAPPSHASQQYHVLCGQAKAAGMRVAKRRLKSRCARRHWFTATNTYVTPQGWRRCRTCQRMSETARAQERKRDRTRRSA